MPANPVGQFLLQLTTTKPDNSVQKRPGVLAVKMAQAYILDGSKFS